MFLLLEAEFHLGCTIYIVSYSGAREVQLC